ncbi:hypothetical protein SKAU_G00394350 [Synaphobranchus kaupii]|uniref:Uncharacterized protein n=1 Tax=Synaphobranchus kaupii TaxID=118154 RepID=A0A9Q1IDX0_SYNKA|nr:hypothetical protein SKAU_G00394350 [Synaphobranchus kaupii]
MMGAMKMMTVASEEVATTSVGEIAAPVKVVEEDPQGPTEATAAPVELASETAALEEVTEAAESSSTEEAPPIEVEAGAVGPPEGAETGSAQEPGEEILAEVLEVAAELTEATPEPAVALEETEEISALEETGEVPACHSPEAVADETAAAMVTEGPDLAAVGEAEQAEDSAPSGEEVSLAEETAAAAATEVALVEESSDLEVEQGETPIPSALDTASTSQHEPHQEPTAGSVVEEKSKPPAFHALEAAPEAEAGAPSQEAAAPPAGLEDQVTDEKVAGEESTLEPSPPVEEHDTAVLEDTQQPKSLTEEMDPASVLDETEPHEATEDTEPPEALAQTSQDMKEREEADKTVKTRCQIM